MNECSEMKPKSLAVRTAAASPVMVTRTPSWNRNRRLSTQESVLFGHLMSPTPEIFNVPLAVNLRGALNEEAWQEAFNVVVQRHEVLRTRYFVNEGLPLMHTDDFAPIAIKRVTFSGTSPADEEQVWKVIEDEARRPFDLGEEWPIRVTLLCLGKDQHTLIVVLHHICCDERSLSILRDQLVSVYEAYVEGRTWTGAPISMQYWEYAEAQHRWMLGPEMQRELAFWRDELAGVPAALALAGKRSGAQPARATVSVCAGSIDAVIADRCLSLCDRYRATPFVLLLAALSATLRQHTGMTDVLIGTPISTRDSEEAERLIGFFVNTIVLRTKVEQGMTFAQLFQRTRAIAFRAFSHRNIPFQKLVEELAPAREPDVHPLFRVMLSFHQETEEQAHFGGLTASQVEVQSHSLKCDLLISARLKGSKINLECEFNTARLDLQNAQLILKKFTSILQFASLHPTAPLEEGYQLLDLIDRESFESHAAEIRSNRLGVLKTAKRAEAQT